MTSDMFYRETLSLLLLCVLMLISFCSIIIIIDGLFKNSKKHGPGWWKFIHGKVRPGEWKDDELLRWTGPEQHEAQMKAKKLKSQQKRASTNAAPSSAIATAAATAASAAGGP